MATKLFRVILPVNDIVKATNFYTIVLSMPGIRVSPGRHYFDCGGTILVCYDAAADGDSISFKSNPEYFYFAVDDLEAAFDRAKNAGCQKLDDKMATRPWGERSFYAQDPFGNPICFVDDKTTFTGQAAASMASRTSGQ